MIEAFKFQLNDLMNQRYQHIGIPPTQRSYSRNATVG